MEPIKRNGLTVWRYNYLTIDDQHDNPNEEYFIGTVNEFWDYITYSEELYGTSI